MTSAVLAARAHADRVRVAVGADTIAAATLTLFVGVLAILTWGTWGDLDSDTGYDLVAAHRITEGELIFRDFVYYYGPLGPALLALFSLVGGADFPTALALGLPIALGIVAATYVLARAVVGSVGALLAAAIVGAVAFIPDNYSYVVPHTTNMTLGMLLLLGILIAIWRYAESGRSRWLAFCGIGLGLITLTKPEPAVAAILAVAAWLLLRRTRAALRRGASLVAVPALLIGGLVYAPLLATVGPRKLLLENLYPVDYLDAAGAKELDGRMPLTPSSFFDVGGKFALYSVGVVALLVAGALLARGGLLRRVALAGTATAGLLAVSAALINPEALRHGLQYAYGWIPVGAAIATVALVVRAIRSRATSSSKDQVWLAGAVALTALAATTYPGFFPHAPHEQMAAYYIPLAAVFLAAVHLDVLPRSRGAYILGACWLAFLALAGAGLALKDANEDSVAVRGPGGSVRETAFEAPLYAAALDWIEHTTERGEAIFTAPLMTGLYPLSQRWSPVDEIGMLPGALPDAEDERRAIAALERANVQLVLTDDRTWPGYEHGAFGETFDPLLAQWIESNFRLADKVTVPAHESFEGDKGARTLFVWQRRKG